MIVFWWEQSTDYWDIPFFSEFGMNAADVNPQDRHEQMAAREQLWAQRELDCEEGEITPETIFVVKIEGTLENIE